MAQVLDLTLRGTTEQREDRWVRKCSDLGILVYGSTEEEVQESFAEAVDALVNSFGENHDLLTSWLDQKQVDYRYYSRPEEMAEAGTFTEPTAIPFKERRRVPVGAPA